MMETFACISGTRWTCCAIFQTAALIASLLRRPTGYRWGLRDYGTGEWDGGDPDCDHLVREDARIESSTLGGGKSTTGHQREGFKESCPRCGARRVDKQIGLEPTPDLFVTRMVAVFREIRRVLADHGTCWLNLGDSYATSGGNDRNGSSDGAVGRGDWPDERLRAGLKPKDLVGIPWRCAFALQSDGWYLRSDIVWAKSNPMPESVTDRPTKAHEYVFLLTKQPRYFFDQEAVREPHTPDGRKHTTVQGGNGSIQHRDGERWPNAGRNIRSVWNIATQPFSGSALGGGTAYTASPGCPRHGLLAAPQRWQKAADGEPPDSSQYRIDSTDARRALELHAESEATISRSPSSPASSDAQTPGNARENRTPTPSPSGDSRDVAESDSHHTTHTESSRAPRADSSDSMFPSDSLTATGRSTRNRKTASLTISGGTASEETPDRTERTSQSNVTPGPDDSGSHDSSETHAGTSRTCTCTRIVHDHFATFPEELARRCILAGCPERGTVLDPFVGSGTVCKVARDHQRRSIGIDLNEQYLELAARRLQQLSLLNA